MRIHGPNSLPFFFGSAKRPLGKGQIAGRVNGAAGLADSSSVVWSIGSGGASPTISGARVTFDLGATGFNVYDSGGTTVNPSTSNEKVYFEIEWLAEPANQFSNEDIRFGLMDPAQMANAPPVPVGVGLWWDVSVPAFKLIFTHVSALKHF